MSKKKMLSKSKILSFLLCFCLLFEQTGLAQVAGALDISGHIIAFRNQLIQDKFRPLHLRSLGYDNNQNNFRLLLDKGDLKNPKKPELETTTKTLLNYFFVGITLPNDAFWVNLRPDSENNIIDSDLATTDVGKILLETDLQLKKDTAKFTSPETPEGKEYWERLYQKAGELLGCENITIPTLTRPWIVPGEIIIRETKDNAYIYKATLKVMLEQDYLKDSATYNFDDSRLKILNEYSSQLIRNLIIPKLTKEVNTSQRYAPLKQVYYSLILAQWFKSRFCGKDGVYSCLIDRKNLQGLTSKISWSKAAYFKAYQRSFKNGEYNIQQPVYAPYGQTIRRYFSGGFVCNISMPAIVSSGVVAETTKGLTKVTVISGDKYVASPLTNNNVGALAIYDPTMDPSEKIKITITGKVSSSSDLPAGSSRLCVSSAILSEDSEEVGQKEAGRQNEVDSRITVPFNRLISALRNHIGKTGSSFYEIMKGRILSGKQPIIDGDKIGNVGQINTLGTFIDEHFALPEEAARESITNAYDSMCDELDPGQRKVQVELRDNFLSVSDSGSGMSLDTILKKFLPPFEGGKSSDILAEIRNILDDGKSEKIPRIKQLINVIDTTVLSDVERLTINDIQRRLGEGYVNEAQRLTVIKNIVTFTGRFGIGFYSLLYFLKTDQDFIGVVTCTKTEAHRIQFFRRNGELQTAITVLSLSGLNRGTKVILRSQSFNKTNAQKVINQFLQFNANARISVSIDGIAPIVINEEVFNPIRFERISNETQVEAFYSRGENTSGKTVVYITVHGVTIMNRQIDGFGMPETVVFNFPANIGLPISRNKIMINEIFIEKAKDMIQLIASKPELLSAFFPCIEVLESNANASYYNIMANAVADAAYSFWRYSGLVYLPNEQEYDKIKHDEVVLVDKRLLRLVFLKGFANPYYRIGDSLVFDSGEKAVIGNKHVYLVDFTDETKFVATSDAILINRRHAPKTDTDKALYNVLLELNHERRFKYVYQPQTLVSTDSSLGSEIEFNIHIATEKIEQIKQVVMRILNSLPDKTAKLHFEEIVEYLYIITGQWKCRCFDALMLHINNPELFLDVYNLFVKTGWSNYLTVLRDNYREDIYRICGFLSKDKLQVIFENKRLKQLIGYFIEEDSPSLFWDLLIGLMRESDLSREALTESIERLWGIREKLKELLIIKRIGDSWINIIISGILLDGDTYKKFQESLAAAERLSDQASYDILFSDKGLELFIEGGVTVIKRVAGISRRLDKASGLKDIGVSKFHSLALSMRNMSDDEIERFIDSVIKKGSKCDKALYYYYLIFWYGEEYYEEKYLVKGFDDSRNRMLESIIESGFAIQEKKRFVEAVMQAEGMFHLFSKKITDDLDGYSVFHFDFTPDELAQINNPALFVLFVNALDLFKKSFLYRKYLLEKQDENVLLGYHYELRYEKELLRKIIVIFRRISNLQNDEFCAVCSDFKAYFSRDKMTNRIEPYIQYLLNSQDAVDIKDKELHVQPQRKFTLVELYDTFLELPPEEEAREESAGMDGDFSGIDRRIERAIQTNSQQLTKERRKFLRNTFRAVAQQSVDDLVMIREVVQNVIDETPSDTQNQRVSINTYRKAVKALQGEQELTVIDIEDTIGMNAERLFNKLLMPFSSSKKDPEKFLGKQGQGFFTLLANSEYAIIKTVRDGKVCILRLTPERQNGQVVDFYVEEQRRDTLAGENNSTRIQTFIKSALPGLEAARVSFAGQRFAALVDSNRLIVEVNGKQINLNSGKMLATAKSRYGEVEFYSLAGESFMALGGLSVKPIDDGLLALIPSALRPILLQHGFAVNLPFQKVKRIQGGSDIANREEVYAGIKDAVALGAMKLVIAMFARGELPSLGLLGNDYYDWSYDRQAAKDAQALIDGSADIDYIRTKYFSPHNTNQLAKLLLAVPLDFLKDIFGEPISLVELFERFKTDRQFFDDSVMDKLPQTIKDAFKAIEEKDKKEKSQQKAAKELGVPEQLIGSNFFNLPRQQGEGMAVYWAFLEMSDVITQIAIEAMSQENSVETIGHLQSRLEYLHSNPPHSHYYAQANGLSIAHAQQGGREYAWNLLEQKENLKLFYQYLNKQIPLAEFLDKAFENIIETLSHELTHILEESSEALHNDVSLNRQKLMVSAMIGARDRIAAVVTDIVDNTQYTNNLGDVQIKDFLDYVVRSQTELPVSDAQVVIPTDTESTISNPDSAFSSVAVQPDKSSQDTFDAPVMLKGQVDKKGGIDFRILSIINQQINMGILKLTTADLNRLSNINLDSEWAQIQNIVNAGIIPYERIKEYVLVSCLRQNLGSQMDKVLGCIADIMRIEEDLVSDADAELKDMLVLIEAGKPETELQCGLSQAKISPQEPQLITP